MTRRTLTPTDVPSAANVLAIFRVGTADDVSEGRGWYARARSECLAIAAQYGVTLEVVAVVLAIISPSTPWARNVYLTRLVFSRVADGASFDDLTDKDSPLRLPMMSANARKAAAVALGADPWSIISGPKVTPFAQRVIDAATGATGPASVVIDRHAHDIALGRVTSDRERGVSLGRSGGHHAFAMAYVRAASVLRRTGEAPGITPAELQAVTWVVWRAQYGHAMARAEARRDAAA